MAPRFVNGVVYATVGSSDRHNSIALNLAGALSDRCQVFSTDMKLRIEAGRDQRFYYPDVFVSCSPTDRKPYSRSEPIFIAEILSPGTERIDRGEKFEAYTSIGSLDVYALTSQDAVRIELFRRHTGWNREVLGQAQSITIEAPGGFGDGRKPLSANGTRSADLRVSLPARSA